MSSLFYLPKVVSLPGARLYFYRTGTSTPQDVYTDEALTIAHSQPVEADAAGVFPPIYLDQTEFNYRVALHTSTDVLIYQVDDIPNNLGNGRNLTIESTLPFIELFDTDGPTNAKRIRISQQGGDLTFIAVDDADAVESTFIKLIRTGVNLDELRLIADDILVVTGGEEYGVGLVKSGTFTGTLSVGYATPPTGTVNYRKINNVVTLWINSGITGTSNANGLQMTGLPADVIPTTGKTVPTASLQDDSNSQHCGECTITAGGAIIFRLARTDLTANYVRNGASSFTTSGGKGLDTGWSITYGLD